MNTDALDPEIRPEERPDAAATLKELARFLGRQAARNHIEADRSRPSSDTATITKILEE